MLIDPLVRARARLALGQLCRTHLYDPNVTLIDIGHKATAGRVERDRLAVRVHVASKLTPVQLEVAAAGGATAPVPRSIGGFETDVIEGRYRQRLRPGTGASATSRRARFDPLRGGISVSRSGRYGAGTLGGIVLDRASGAPMLLSNWHVLVASWLARPGTAVFQPATTDGAAAADQVGRLARDAMSVNLDAAVAWVDDSRSLSALQHQLGRVRGRAQPAHEMRVAKSGRTSGVTRGEISGTDGVMTLRYAGLTRQIRHVITIEPADGADVLSAGGDSGSLFLDEASGACVALHFAGGDFPERALAIDINPVVDALGVEFDAG
ncbi:MAG: hypothetical protein U1F25_14200 [Rubrivivax sp.]